MYIEILASVIGILSNRRRADHRRSRHAQSSHFDSLLHFLSSIGTIWSSSGNLPSLSLHRVSDNSRATGMQCQKQLTVASVPRATLRTQHELLKRRKAAIMLYKQLSASLIKLRKDRYRCHRLDERATSGFAKPLCWLTDDVTGSRPAGDSVPTCVRYEPFYVVHQKP